VKENISLRTLCRYFLKFDPQPPGVNHTADNDAKATMRLFVEVYTKRSDTEDLSVKQNSYSSDIYLK